MSRPHLHQLAPAVGGRHTGGAPRSPTQACAYAELDDIRRVEGGCQ
jgi:hypothetical protein